MYDFIEYEGEQAPDWSNDKRYWMAVCEHIAAHWYFLLTMDEYADLYRLKYPEEETKTIRDAYVFQYYSEMVYRGQELFDKEISKRDTKLTPVVSEGIEYLVSNAAEDKEELFDKTKELHQKRSMYLPTVEEMDEFFQLGFNPSNDNVMDAFANLADLIDFKNSVISDPSATQEQIDRENANRDHVAQGVILSTIRGLERGIKFEEVAKNVIRQYPFSDEFAALLQLREIYNNTHLPGNNGHMPIELERPWET